MKNLIKFIGKSLLGGVFFCIGIILVYAATTISGLGQKTIESGDKIGTGWFNEVDNKLRNIDSISFECFEGVGDYRNGLVAGEKSYTIPSSYISSDNTGQEVCQGLVSTYDFLTGSYNCVSTVDYDGDHTNVNTCYSYGHASWADDAVVCCKYR